MAMIPKKGNYSTYFSKRNLCDDYKKTDFSQNEPRIELLHKHYKI